MSSFLRTTLPVFCVALAAACGGSPAPVSPPGTWRQVLARSAATDPLLSAIAADVEGQRFVIAGSAILLGRDEVWQPVALGTMLDRYQEPRGWFGQAWAGGGRVLAVGQLGFYAGGAIDVGGPEPVIAVGDGIGDPGTPLFGGPARVAGRPHDVWVTGGLAAAHFDGTAWTVMPAGNEPRPFWMTPDGTMWSLDARGLIRRSGESWDLALAATAPRAVTALWGDGTRTVVVAGVGDVEAPSPVGLIYMFDGTRWTSLSAGQGLPAGTGRIWDIWGYDAGDIYAVGDEGLVLHFDGAVWRPESIATAAQVSGVSGLTRGGPMAVSADGIFQRTPDTAP